MRVRADSIPGHGGMRATDTQPLRGPAASRTHVGESARVGGPRRDPPTPRGRSSLLQRPPESARGPRQRRAPAAPPAGFFGPYFLVARAPLFDAAGSPAPGLPHEGGLTSAASAIGGGVRGSRRGGGGRGGGAGSATPGASGEAAEDARAAGTRGTLLRLGTAPASLRSVGLRRTSCLDEGVARSAGTAAPRTI